MLSGRPELDPPRRSAASTLAPGSRSRAGRRARTGYGIPDLTPLGVLILSTMHFPEGAEHPDTGSLLAMTGPQEGKTSARAATSRSWSP